MSVRILAVLLALSGAALAGDWEFDHIVRSIETHYGCKRTHIPFLGLASFVVNVARPAGTSGFKLAVFEDLKSSREAREDLDRFMYGLSRGELRPMVRVHSRRDAESTYIFMGEAGRSTRLLIATFERNQATVVEVKVNVDTLLKWINSPELAGKWDSDR